MPALARQAGGGEIELWSVAPQPFQSVEVPFLLEKDVDDEINVVHQYPLTTAAPFDMGGFQFQDLGQLGFHAFSDGKHVTIGVAVADDEEVGEVAQPSQIQNDEVLGLLVQCGLDTARDLEGNALFQR